MNHKQQGEKNMTGSKLLLLIVSILFSGFAHGYSSVGGDHAQFRPYEHNFSAHSEDVEFQFFGWGSCEELEEVLEKELIDLGCKNRWPHPHAIEPAKCFCPSIKGDLVNLSGQISPVIKSTQSRNSCLGKNPCAKGVCVNGRWRCLTTR